MKITGSVHDSFVKYGCTGKEIIYWMESSNVSIEKLARHMGVLASEVVRARKDGRDGKESLVWMNKIIEAGYTHK